MARRHDVPARAAMPAETGPILEYLAHLGVLLLLFTVGLKLRLRQIAEPHVVGGALLYFGLSVAIFTPFARWLFTDDWTVAVLVGIALAFSSTVLAAKMLEAKRELANFHGRTAIGILIVQNIIALVVLAAFSGKMPGPWALSILAVPLLRPVLHRLLDLAAKEWGLPSDFVDRRRRSPALRRRFRGILPVRHAGAIGRGFPARGPASWG